MSQIRIILIRFELEIYCQFSKQGTFILTFDPRIDRPAHWRFQPGINNSSDIRSAEEVQIQCARRSESALRTRNWTVSKEAKT